MLVVSFLLTLFSVLVGNCEDSFVCNEVTLTPSDYVIKANNTLYIPRANLAIFNATLKGSDGVCVPLSEKFLSCKVKEQWIKYDYAIEFNLSAKVFITGRFYDPTNYVVLQNGSLVTCSRSDDVIKPFLMELGSVNVCYFLFFVVYFFFMAAIFWLNLIAFETWHFFSQMQTSPYNFPSLSTSKKWRLYHLYAWGTPLIMTTLVLTADLAPLPASLVTILDPQLKFYCWIINPIPNAIYYYAPVGILTIVNIIFFGLTVHIIQYASVGTIDTVRCRRKSMLSITTKLIFVMGIFWTVIFVSDVIGSNSPQKDIDRYHLGLFADVIFGSQGILIGLVHIDRLGICKRCKCPMNNQHPDSSRQLSAITMTSSVF
ncbi:hypothetical protein CHUAL_012100 [Chamberlinius hualienensis]